MFRQEVNKQKQKSVDLQQLPNHPSNSLISFMNRTNKITRVHTDNSDGKTVKESQAMQSMHGNQNNLQITRGKSKSVYQLFNNTSATPSTETPNDLKDSMSIHNTKYVPSKFKISANQLLSSEFKNNIEDLSCFKCKNVSDDIKECVGCGHLFCKECVSQSDNACFDEECCFTFENQQNKRNLHWDLREPSKIIQKRINQLTFKCLNEQLGCEAVLDVKNYAEHIDHNCEYMIVECPNQSKECQSFASSPSKQACLYFGPKKYMKDHLNMCNLKLFSNKDASKQQSNDERSIELKRMYTDEYNNTILHSSQEESNFFGTQLQHQNSQFTSKIISLGDEYVQSQMDEIIDINKKMLNQSSIIQKQSEQIDKYYEENRKLKDQIDKLSKDTDLKISKLQASSTQVMLEMQSMKKLYSDKISELFSLIRDLKGENVEKSMNKSQSGGVFTRANLPFTNNSFMNQTLVSQTASDRSESSQYQHPKYFSSNQNLGYEQPQIRINSDSKAQYQNKDIKNLQYGVSPRSGTLFTAKLEEIKSQNGENSSRRSKQNSIGFQNGVFNNYEATDSFSSQLTSYVQEQQNAFHNCRQCSSKLIYTSKQFLNICAGCYQNSHGYYYCQNCTSRFYCVECCPLYIKKGYCPNNHILALSNAKDDYIHRCNICSKIFNDQVAIKQYTCTTCDFDLCSGCMNMKQFNS